MRDFQNSLLFRRLRYNEIEKSRKCAGFSVPFGFCGYLQGGLDSMNDTCVVLNAKKMNFDGKLDFSILNLSN